MTLPPKVWDAALRRLRLELPPFACEAWLESLVAMPSLADGPVADGAPDGRPELRLVCPTSFHRDRVRDRYLPRIRTTVEAEVGIAVEIRLDVIESQDELDGVQEAEETSEAAGANEANARAKGKPGSATQPTNRAVEASTAENEGRVERRPYPARIAPAAADRQPLQPVQQRFESFIVGECNALAREASLAVVRESSPNLSQLYLSSEAGLGKTHLARAVCSEARANGRRAVYTSAEAFTNEFLASLRSRQMERFKRKFRRDCDVLIVEDVQFLEGKDSTQLEFFHSVQHVLDAGGRVVLTGNRLPGALTSLETRVRSQVAGGFVCELGPPDAQVRRNILRAKAAAGGFRLPEDCLELLVDSLRGNVRELEGVLIQLVTSASLLNRPIDVALAREALEKKGAGRAGAPAPRLAPADVTTVVAAFFQTSLDIMASKSRRRDVLLPRQLAMYLCDKYTDASLVEIGRALGRDHPSVRNAIAKIERRLLESAPLRYQAEALIRRLDELGRSRR